MAGVFQGSIDFFATEQATPRTSTAGAYNGTIFPITSALEITRASTLAPVTGYANPGMGQAVTVANLPGEITYSGTITLPAIDWQSLELLFGVVSAQESIPDWVAKAASIDGSNQIVDTVLIGKQASEVRVTVEAYNSTTDTTGLPLDTQLSPTAASASVVQLDNATGTLLFDAAYQNMVATYSYSTTTALKTIGGANQTKVSAYELYGRIAVTDAATKNGIGLYIPKATLSGNTTLGYTVGENPLTVEVSPVVVSPYQEPLILRELV